MTVTVNNPPASGPNAANTSAYEVIITQPQTRYFAGLLGAAPTISGRAVALVGGSPGCVIARATSGTGISIVNATNVGAKNCTVAANSSSPTAVDLLNASLLTASNLNVVGNYQAANASTVVSPPTIIKTNAPATKDPYANLAVPSFNTGGCQPKVTVTNGATNTIGPGCYNGISVSNAAKLTMTAGNYIINGGGGISVTNASTLTMGAGIYIINGGSFSLANATTTTASGASIVLTNTPSAPGTPNWGSVSFVNASNFTLTPPTSGAFQGVAFYMDRNAPATITDTFANASSTSLTGSLYFPSQPVNYANASSAGPACLQLIALTITFANAASFGTSCPPGLVVPGFQQQVGTKGPRRMTNWTPRATLHVLTGHLCTINAASRQSNSGWLRLFSRFCFGGHRPCPGDLGKPASRQCGESGERIRRH